MDQRGFIPILIAVLIAVAVGGYFIYQQQTKTTLPAASPTQTTAQPSPTPEETANWKTYSSTEYKFQFKYPPDWLIKETAPPRLIKDKNGVTLLFSVMTSSLTGHSLIDINIFDDPNNTIDTFDTTGAVRSKMGEITAWEQKTGEWGKLFSFRSVIKNQYIGIGSLGSSSSTEEELSILDQILSTFKFTQ